MEHALTIKQYLSLNKDKYVRKSVRIDDLHTNAYVTIHPDRAATDRLHFHEDAHLSLIVRGGLLDKRKHTTRERSGGDIMFFRSGEPHESIYHGFPVTNVNLELESSFFSGMGVTESALAESIAKGGSAKLTMLRIFAEMTAYDDISPDAIEMLLFDLVNYGENDEKGRPAWLSKVVDQLNDDWNADLSIRDLAFTAGVHPKTVCKIFSRFFNCTIGEYKRRIRIERSLKMIHSRGPSLTEVALECGFYDQSHFTASFKRLTGLLPKQYRKL